MIDQAVARTTGRRFFLYTEFQQTVDVVLRRALAIRSPTNAQRRTATEAPVTSSSTPGLARFNTQADARRPPHCTRCVPVRHGGKSDPLPPPVRHHRSPALRERHRHGGTRREDLAEAMAGHPPIGRPKPGGDPTSSREQRGMAGASEELKAEMLELNLAYQERFGHVFLICATGATGEQMRDAVKSRTGNSPEQERGIVRTELGKINRIRLTRLVTEDA